MVVNYLLYLSDAQKLKLRDEITLWLSGKSGPPDTLRPGLIGMVTSGLTKLDAENVLRQEGVLSMDAALPASYWYGIRRASDAESGPPASVVARRLMLEETSVGAIQRSRKLGQAFDVVADAVLMGDYDRTATLIRLAEAIRMDEATISAMDTGDDVAHAMTTGAAMPDRVQGALSLSALDELAHLIRGLDADSETSDAETGN
jgi:hypothetical protein